MFLKLIMISDNENHRELQGNGTQQEENLVDIHDLRSVDGLRSSPVSRVFKVSQRDI